MNWRLDDLPAARGPFPFTFGTAAFDGRGPELRYHYEGFTTVIELDRQEYAAHPTDSKADATIILFGHHALAASDFIL
jgi:hypothetical protein